MSTALFDRNPDLVRLRADGYELEVRGDYLLLGHVPYVTAAKTVAYGTLVSTLNLLDGRTQPPDTHVAFFAGEYPCNADGTPIAQLKHGSAKQRLGDGIDVDHSFSNKPEETGKFPDYYEKMTSYVRVISSPARAIDASVTATTFAAPHADEERLFRYTDTNPSSVEILAMVERLRGLKIIIIGVGGSGSYVLDAVAKTLVRQIHLFDGDRLRGRNAFRAPGAASVEDLEEAPFKADYFKEIYARMRSGIHSHPIFIDASNVGQLSDASFVFLCIDKGTPKKVIIDHLEGLGIPFIDVGMGIDAIDGKLAGMVRTTTSTSAKRDHVRRTVSFEDPVEDDYDKNIQIAELNMLNAALAVIRWKKFYGIYHDLQHEHTSQYTIVLNSLANSDHAT